MRNGTAVTLGIVVSLALVGCAQSPVTHPTSTKTSAVAPTPTATSTPTPTYDADGSAEDNKAYFDLVNEKLFASDSGALGRPIIDNLVAAGFTKADMQVTPDKTTIGNAADSVLFSVKIGNDCLLGQHGGGGYSSAVAPALNNGDCLIGLTRAIDW